MRIAIQGAGVAGPTLAFWLRRAGHDVLVVEESPRLRRGGYIIDFWGVGYEVAEKMGLVTEIRKAGYHVEEVRLVSQRGRRCGGFSTAALDRLTGGRFTSLRRSDLASIIYHALDDGVETIFGDSICAIVDDGDCVQIQFDRAGPREVDLVVGADGLHSRVRRIAFGPDEKYEIGLGFYVAAFEVQGYRPRDELIYVSHAAPGRQVSRFSMRDDKTLFLFVFREEHLVPEQPVETMNARAALERVYAGVGWECRRILDAMSGVDEIYFDRVSQIRMDRWSNGRTVLIGDAAACVSLLAGEGTGLAMAEAYVLAGELNRGEHDVREAIARYENRMRPLLRKKQRSAARFASSFAPSSAVGVQFRNLVTRLLGIPMLAEFVFGRTLRDDFVLPDYSTGAPSRARADSR